MNQIPKLSPHYYFKLANGRIIKNLKELPEILHELEKLVFDEHVTPNKNDFAKWVYDVYRLDDLSYKLGPVKSKEELVRILFAYLNQKKKTLEQNTDDPIIRNTQEQQTLIKEPKPMPKKEPTAVKPSSKSSVFKWKGNVAPVVEKKSPVKEEKTVKKVEAPKKVDKVIHNINDATEFFEKNPVIMSQVVDAKKKALKIEPLEIIAYSGYETPKKLVEIFKDYYAKAYERIQFLRKNGFDTSLAEIMLFRIPPKIKVYEASNENKDCIIVKRYLKEIIEELNNMKP